MKVIGANLKRARIAAGLSQRDVFKLTGIQPAMQVDVERGARNLTVRSLAKLAAAVGVTVTEIVTPQPKTRRPPSS